MQDLDISDTTAFILCSSGTTSKLKGISRSHKQFIVQVYIHDQGDLEPGTCFFPLGPYWSVSVFFLIYSTLYGFKRVITSQQISPESLINIIDRQKVTFVICSPTTGQKMMKCKNYRPLGGVKNVRVTAQKIHESAVNEIQEVFPNAKLSTAYGSTELDGITRSLGGLKGNSSGQVVFNYSVKVSKTEFLNLLQNIFSQ